MKALYNLKYNEFEKLVKENLRIDGWFVYDDSASSRRNQVYDRHYFVKLKQRADETGIPAHENEIISWLDTLNLLYYALDRVNSKFLDEMQIIQEYTIPLTSKRADYLLVSKNKILILEFSFDKFGEEYKFETKLSQAVNYKELLSNLLPSYIKIGTYTFMINPEVDHNGDSIHKYNKYRQKEELANNEKLDELGAYINLFFSDRNDALTQLEYLDGYMKGVEDTLKNN